MIDLRLGDCLDVMAAMPGHSVDAVVTDPPYGISFMGREWDTFAPGQGARGKGRGRKRGAMGRCEPSPSMVAGEYDLSPKGMEAFLEFSTRWSFEALRVLKPGGHLVSFASTRTSAWMIVGIGRVGFEIRDTIHWCYWSGFPKSKNVALAIDKGEGHPNRGRAIPTASRYQNGTTEHLSSNPVGPYAPQSDAAKQWDGWGTALKPAVEPAVLARKPLDGSVAANVQRWGTGALNIDGCRMAHGDPAWPGPNDDPGAVTQGFAGARTSFRVTSRESVYDNTRGRWPANLFYCSKASRAERERGCEHLPPRTGAEAVDRKEGSAGAQSPSAGAGRTAASVRNHHPTVKPVDLMAWLCRLVTPPGGVVLDPFMGSGTTGIGATRGGFDFIGIEREAEYLEIARARIGGDSPLFNRTTGGAA